MAISDEYRPGIATTADLRVDVDGWAAGGGTSPGVIDSQGTQWRMFDPQGWHGAPLVRESLTERPSEHGAFDGMAYLQPRVITLEGTAVAVDAASAARSRDIFASVCGDPSLGLTTLAVSWPGRPAMQAAVRRSGENRTAEMTPTTFRWSMILVAPDPRRYAAAESSEAVGLPTSGSGGLVFPLVFPLTFGTGAVGGQVTVTNTGTITVWPTFTILGPVTGPIIRNLTTGQRLEFDPAYVLAGGQTLVIDPDAKTVFEATTSRRDKLFVAQWFGLPPGDTALRFESVGVFDPATELTVTWRDGWS